MVSGSDEKSAFESDAGQDEIWDSVSVPAPTPEDLDHRLCTRTPSVVIVTEEVSALKSQLGSLKCCISSSSTSSGTSGTDWR